MLRTRAGLGYTVFTAVLALHGAGCGSTAERDAGVDAAPESAIADSSAPDTGAPDASAPDASAPDAVADARTDSSAADASAALAYPIVDPPAGFGAFPAATPVVLNSASGRTVSGVSIANPAGDCIAIHGGADIVVEDVAIGPCAGAGIAIDGDATRVTVRRVYVHDTGSNGVETQSASAVVVSDSHFARNTSGGYFVDSTGVRFERNTVLNVQGPRPRGQLAQLNRAFGAGNAIRCNVAQNDPGRSSPEDAVNLFESNGTAASPIVVEGNRIRGGGPSTSGGGILLGDGSGSYQVARGNVVVDPGQYGIAVAGGSHMAMSGNTVFARQQVFTNVGMYVWNQYVPACTDVVVQGNQVRWTNHDGADNPFWNGGNCTAVTVSGNTWDAALTSAVIDAVPEACR